MFGLVVVNVKNRFYFTEFSFIVIGIVYDKDFFVNNNKNIWSLSISATLVFVVLSCNSTFSV